MRPLASGPLPARCRRSALPRSCVAPSRSPFRHRRGPSARGAAGA
ncbi:hypothetical protein ATKI12_0937 [Kitasatospora sp. Ki12]